VASFIYLYAPCHAYMTQVVRQPYPYLFIATISTQQLRNHDNFDLEFTSAYSICIMTAHDRQFHMGLYLIPDNQAAW
jgi:hypothetical protein